MSNLNVSKPEVSKFSDENAHWWDRQGPLKTLHDINPLRMDFIRQKVTLKNLAVIDVGCGGGILSASLAEDGATVTGIDMNASALDAARANTCDAIEYLQITAEEMASKHPQTFDVVTCFELLEHVPSPASLISACATLVKPNGHVFFSTLNRTLKAYLFAIVGAEYLLNLLPKRTHDYGSFVRPSELSSWAREQALQVEDVRGLSYNPFTKVYQLSSDISVNYLMHCRK